MHSTVATLRIAGKTALHRGIVRQAAIGATSIAPNPNLFASIQPATAASAPAPTFNFQQQQVRCMNIDTKKLKALDEPIVRKIHQELVEADTGGDGRISDRDIKRLLRKHNSTFTDAEIVELGELFYASKAGGTVSIDRFIAAVDYAASGAAKDEGNPLGVGNCVPEYMFVKTVCAWNGLQWFAMDCGVGKQCVGVYFFLCSNSHHFHSRPLHPYPYLVL